MLSPSSSLSKLQFSLLFVVNIFQHVVQTRVLTDLPAAAVAAVFDDACPLFIEGW